METEEECVCCAEIQQIKDKCQEEDVSCITMHPGFDAVCLNIYVLQTAYHQYRYHYNNSAHKTVEE